ncbi:hypothetical protein LTR62_007791 [Meristemomyces frigidus]|uniref:Uncharacterized protein n=1 Tax=Meristemomyces frigidus TaxID=1508187 RepID=A0AAN7YDA8_9PEZI|nr:hypothetical protein LTR62_007791 [Meristemomyces frigidus]
MLLALPAATLMEKAATNPEPKPVAPLIVRPYRNNRPDKYSYNTSPKSDHQTLLRHRPQLPLYPRLRRSLPLAGHYSWSPTANNQTWSSRTTIDKTYISAFRVDNFDDNDPSLSASRGGNGMQSAPGLMSLLQAAASMETGGRGCGAVAGRRKVGLGRKTGGRKEMRYRFVAAPQSAKV